MSLHADHQAFRAAPTGDSSGHDAATAMSHQSWGAQGLHDMRQLNLGAAGSRDALPAGMPSADSLFSQNGDRIETAMMSGPANDNVKPEAPPKVYPISPTGKMWVVPIDSLPPGGQLWISQKGVTVLTPEQVP